MAALSKINDPTVSNQATASIRCDLTSNGSALEWFGRSAKTLGEGGRPMKVLTAIPVYNEERHVEDVLREVRRYTPNILVVNDGSTDGTAALLAKQRDVQVITHAQNRGYGAALISAFAYALERSVDVLVTMDCDGQHEPARIPVLLEAIHDADIVSGSRYLRDFRQNTLPPQDRQQINR